MQFRAVGLGPGWAPALQGVDTVPAWPPRQGRTVPQPRTLSPECPDLTGPCTPVPGAHTSPPPRRTWRPRPSAKAAASQSLSQLEGSRLRAAVPTQRPPATPDVLNKRVCKTMACGTAALQDLL